MEALEDFCDPIGLGRPAYTREDLAEAGLCRCDAGTLTSEGNRGRRCLLLGDGKGNYAFLVLLELDSLGRVRELTITNNPQYDFELMR